MLQLIFLKIIITVTIVVIVSLIAEHISPRAAGIVSGYPLGGAIVLFFYGLENGTQFASESAIFDMMGIAALLSFLFFYYHASKIKIHKILQIIVSIFAAIVGFFLIAWPLHLIEANRLIAVLLPIFSILAAIYLFKNIKNITIEKKIKFNHKILFVRAIFAGFIVLIITSVANIVGSTWAGLFSAFPKTLFPLLMIIHYTYDTKHVHSIIKNVPLGLGSLIMYSLTVSFVYPLYGVYVGTVLAYAVATLYLLMLFVIKERL